MSEVTPEPEVEDPLLELMREGLSRRQAVRYLRQVRKQARRQYRRAVLRRFYEDSMPADAEQWGLDENPVTAWMKKHRILTASLAMVVLVIMLFVWTALLQGSAVYSVGVFVAVLAIGTVLASWWGRGRRR